MHLTRGPYFVELFGALSRLNGLYLASVPWAEDLSMIRRLHVYQLQELILLPAASSAMPARPLKLSQAKASRYFAHADDHRQCQLEDILTALDSRDSLLAFRRFHSLAMFWV